MPEYRDEWIVINDDQDVKDIIREIQDAHKEFADYYDKIAPYFDADDINDVCERLYWFCNNNIRYKEESQDFQTTALPTGILTRGFGDCKHYASFCGGVLDAINRMTDKRIDWSYRFASYRLFNWTPHHVFVVVRDGPYEIWIDPTPGSDEKNPTWLTDKKIKKSMALYRNIAGVNSDNAAVLWNSSSVGGNTIGWTWDTSTGWTKGNDMPTVKWGDPFYGPDFLGVSRYGNIPRDDKAFIALRDNLQSYINKYSPEPYQLSTDMLAKAINENIQNWNFLYPKGTSHTPRNWKPYLQDYVLLTITDDGRLTFDRDVEPPHNYAQIHKLVDWVNFLVQHYSDKPYIPTIEHVKRLGKGWKTPQDGSLWHVIHTGDVNLAKFTNFAKGLLEKIPGLKNYLAQFGLSADSLTNFAGQFGWGNTGTGIDAPIDPADPFGEGVKKKSNLLLIGVALGAGYLLYRSMNTRKKVSGINATTGLLIGGGAFLVFMLSRKKGQEPEQESPPVTNPDTPAPPSTSTPVYVPDSGNQSANPFPYAVDYAREACYERADRMYKPGSFMNTALKNACDKNH